MTRRWRSLDLDLVGCAPDERRCEGARAVAALATAKEWPVLNDMEKRGHYPDVLYEFVAAMPKDDWYGRPLTKEVDSAFACDRLGVELP